MEGVVGLSRQAGAVQADQLVLIAELYRSPQMRPVVGDRRDSNAFRKARGHAALTVDDLVVAELRAGLHVGPSYARRLLEAALALTSRLPRTLTAMRQGGLDLCRAMLVVERSGPLAADHFRLALRSGLSPEAADQAAVNVSARVEEEIYPAALKLGPRAVVDRVAQAVMRVDPGFAEREAGLERGARRVSCRTNPQDGMGEVYAHLSAVDAQAVYATLDGYARLARHHGDPRCLDELRADAFTHLILNGHLPDQALPTQKREPGQGLAYIEIPQADACGNVPVHPDHVSPVDHADPPAVVEVASTGEAPVGSRPARHSSSASGLRAHVLITIDLSTLLGLNDHPAHLDDHGPITAQYARALAHDPGSTWRRLVTDPHTGQLLDYGRTTYRPPAALDHHVRARDRTCRTPGCTIPATSCDADHVIPFPAGTTDHTNLHTQCRRHHRLKHEGGWRHRISQDPDHAPGTLIITSRTGRHYISHPPSIGPVVRPSAPHPVPSGPPPQPLIDNSSPTPDHGQPPF